MTRAAAAVPPASPGNTRTTWLRCRPQAAGHRIEASGFGSQMARHSLFFPSDTRSRRSIERGPMTPNKTLESLLRRIEGEYLEMPGLQLTREQAQRLWVLDCDTCC